MWNLLYCIGKSLLNNPSHWTYSVSGGVIVISNVSGLTIENDGGSYTIKSGGVGPLPISGWLQKAKLSADIEDFLAKQHLDILC